MNARLRILLVDDHEVVRRGIRALLESHRHWKICGEAATGREAVKKARGLKPDLVVLDLSIPDMDGTDIAREIRNTLPETEILVFTMYDSGRRATEAMAAGARGVVLKSEAARDLVRGVEALSRHKPYLSPRVTEVIVGGLAKGVDMVPPASDLTARERETLKLLAEGKSSKEIAVALGISPKTASAHRANIVRKLKLHSLSDLIYYAIRNGIVKV